MDDWVSAQCPYTIPLDLELAGPERGGQVIKCVSQENNGYLTAKGGKSLSKSGGRTFVRKSFFSPRVLLASLSRAGKWKPLLFGALFSSARYTSFELFADHYYA